MKSVGCLLVLFAVIAGSGSASPGTGQTRRQGGYAAAYYQSQQTKRPLVVLVGAKWCPACQRLEREAFPRLHDAGILKKAVIAVVDYDEEPRIAQELTRGGPIPQLFVFHPTEEGWKGQRIIGYRSPEAVVSFVTQAIESESGSQPEKSAAATDLSSDKNS